MIPHRLLVSLSASALLLTLSACSSFFNDSVPQTKASTGQPGDFYALKTTSLEGQPVDLSAYRGKVALVVNTASKCGYTPQYEGLEALYQQFKDKGLVVLGFPSGDFGGQEFDSAQEIRDFCNSRYHVTFPMFAKVQTKTGEGQSPIYGLLGGETGSLPGWNFGKYLVDKEGHVVQFFATPVKPNSTELVKAIETELAK